MNTCATQWINKPSSHVCSTSLLDQLPWSTRSSASDPVLVLPGLSARQRYVAESGGWTRLTCSEPDGSVARRESGSKVSSRSSLFFCQRMIGTGSPETSQRSRAVSPRYEETDSVGTTTFNGPGMRQEEEDYDRENGVSTLVTQHKNTHYKRACPDTWLWLAEPPLRLLKNNTMHYISFTTSD